MGLSAWDEVVCRKCLIYIMFPCVGPPSAPMLTVTPRDSRTFNFTITPPTPSECVIGYILNVTTAAAAPVMIHVPANGTVPDMNVFDVCAVDYYFTLVPVTNVGVGSMRGTYSHRALTRG